jgi:monoterpene epsilon-lactone hydrolase
MSLRGELLRVLLRHTVKRATREEPGIGLMRREFNASKRFIAGAAQGTRAVNLDAGGVEGVQITVPRSRSSHQIFYLHGGGYVSGSSAFYRDFIWRIADASAAGVLCVNYRLAPEYPFPAALDDAVNAYRWLLANGAAPERTSLMGDSAGGGLVFATLLRLKEQGLPMPAAAVALSPWTDLALTGESFGTNAYNDPMLRPERAANCAQMYLDGADPRDCYASPLYGNLGGLPPTLIQVGSDEILLDDSIRMAERLRSAGCDVEIEVWPRMPHVWQVYARVLPEGRQAIARIGDFLQSQMMSEVPGARRPH